jgi:hypothetical protein
LLVPDSFQLSVVGRNTRFRGLMLVPDSFQLSVVAGGRGYWYSAPLGLKNCRRGWL